ncbi:hypothetical protein C7S20_16855 [Christiangramia fulva]|uniref:Calx-beta domain-containing protein n=1 Tax=Christiangramia fulva TaxID=2126553 RepID=A0A2R3Z951_9FLAO|nr:hypothetical protein [Christiangramia fulva]AVR46795.1 hypothetical protein C7S20_16855 [Christiangramia fulva]
MKTLNNIILGLFTALAISCSKDDDENPAAALPVTMEFTADVMISELSTGQEININFNKPAQVAGTIKVELSDLNATGFTTVPAISNGEINIPVAKGATKASFSFIPQDNDQFEENQRIYFELVEMDDNFLVGEKNILEVTILDNEQASAAEFAWSNLEILENNTSEPEIFINFPTAVPGEGKLKILVQGESVANLLQTVPAMDANNVIEITIPSGATSTTIKLKPVNNNLLEKHNTINFSIIEATGSLVKGNRLQLSLLLKDDELAGKLHTVETTTGAGKVLKTIEYDSNGRISKVKRETNGSSYIVTQTYWYDENGKLTGIAEIAGDYEAFFWENGKIVRSEVVVGFFGIRQSVYEHQNGKLSLKRDFNLDLNRNANETDRYAYTYNSDGTLATEVHTTLINGVWTEISTHTFNSYSQLPDPSYGLEVTPFLFPQQNLYMILKVQNNSITDNFYYLHIFDTEGNLIERKRNDNQENIKYSYY